MDENEADMFERARTVPRPAEEDRLRQLRERRDELKDLLDRSAGHSSDELVDLLQILRDVLHRGLQGIEDFCWIEIVV